MPGEPPIMEVYSTGLTTVVGFGGRELLDTVNLAACREEIVSLIAREHCRVLAVDFTGVRMIPSGLLGLLASVRQLGAEVHLYNPSDDVREVLSITNLDRLMPVFEIDLS